MEISKDNILSLLELYKTISEKEIYDYLKGLIYLEYSIFDNNISDNIKEKISNLELYQQIVFYNIYNKYLKLLSNNKFNQNIIKNQNIIRSQNDKDFQFNAQILIENNRYNLFDFYFTNNYSIIDIYLYEINNQYLDYKEKLKHINSLKKRIEYLKNHSMNMKENDAYIMKYNALISDLLREIKILEISDNEKKELLEISNYYYEAFLHEFNINPSTINKTLTKKYPKINIINNKI